MDKDLMCKKCTFYVYTLKEKYGIYEEKHVIMFLHMHFNSKKPPVLQILGGFSFCFLDIEVTSLPLYKILSTVEKEVTE
ncbi:hypothetical protein C1N86_07960 [Priestia aryabhattai]